jgi:hypothetical protein
MKTIKITTLATLLIIVFVAAMCRKYDNAHEYITIINKSHEKIVYQEWVENITTLSSLRCYEHGFISIAIQADSFRYCESPIRPSGWEYYLDKGQILNIMIGSGKAYDQYRAEPCDTFQKYVPVLHQYLLTLEDLNRMNWTVVYPPEE